MPQELNSFSSNARICCPFFKEQHSRTVYCEGIFDKQTTTILTFPYSAFKNKHIENFCVGAKMFQGCPVAIAIMERLELNGEI